MIYFIQDSSTFSIKIGHTAGDPGDRLKSLQTGNAAGLILLAAHDGAQEDERELHQRFAVFHERGEWFRPAPEIIRHIISTASLAAHDAGLRSGHRPAETIDRQFEAANVLASLRASGFRLWLGDDKLLVSPASKLTPEHRYAIRSNREELVALVSSSE